ncbi:MAG: hypothetical protein IKB16_06370, partial [Lentisphaeria bacterium]|nr:hypothetical protein [Lentisphaeria bacterium]
MSEKNIILEMPIRMNECGPDGTLRSHIWFDYLQHIAAIHAEKLGFGISAIKENGLIWVLSRIKVVMEDAPRYDDILQIESYHNGAEKLFAKRQFIISSAVSGKRFGYASSFWLTLELPSFRPRPPAVFLGEAVHDNEEKEEFFSMLDKLSCPGELSGELHYDINSSVIDLNDHLNNTFYSAYALDWVANARQSHIHFKEIQVNYNRAMQFGEKLIVKGCLTGDDGFYVE